MNGAIWRFELLGRLRAQRGAQSPAHISVRRIGVLLACLVMRGPSPVPRDELISLLWPDDPIDAARNRLRVLLNNLKQHLEPADAPGTVIAGGRTTVELLPGSFTSDYHEFSLLIARAATQADEEAIPTLERAMALYRGELLDGLTDEWIVIERRRVAEVRYQALRGLVNKLNVQGEHEKAADYARQAVISEPLDEEAHADLIELYESLGRPSAGLRQFEQLKRLLNTELHAQPSDRTKAIAARLTTQLGHGISELKRTLRSVQIREQQSGPIRMLERSVAPVRLTRFFGREKEIKALCAMVDADSSSRLVTIVGPGGIGKTSVAIQIAHLMANSFCGRVYFAELAEVLDSATAPDALEKAIGLPPSNEADPLSRTIGVLAREPALLILDNLEQIVPTICPTISTLLAEASSLHCLITSRRSLGVDGEREFPLGPLLSPAPEIDAELLSSYPGVALFLDRARAVRPTFADSPTAVRDVAEIVRSLEGLPLAIELAAARARSMSSAEIKRQTSGLLNLLVEVQGSRPVRHRSLRATINWSYLLLTPEEQQMFISLAVFAGGFTAEAAAFVASTAEIDLHQARLLLDQLCIASMVTTRSRSGETEVPDRFALLDSIREFGLELLNGLPVQNAIKVRHFQYFSQKLWIRTLATKPDAGVSASDDDAIAEDELNIRIALDFGLNSDSDREVQCAAVSLLCRLCRYWESHGIWSEGADFLYQALSLPYGAFEGDTHLQITLSAARLTCMLGQYENAVEYAREGLAEAESAGNTLSVSEAHTCLGMVAFFRGNYPQAEMYHSQALNLSLTLHDQKGVASSSASLANVAFYLGRDREAIQRFQEALAIYRELGDPFGSASVLQRLGNVWRQQGNMTQGMRDLSEALETFRITEYRQGIASCLHDIGLLLYFQGNYAAAYERYMESLDLFREIGYRRGEAVCLYNIAAYHIRMGSFAEARIYLREAVELSTRIGDRRNIAACLGALGLLAHQDGRYAESRAEYERSLSIETEIGSRGGVSNCMIGLGRVALETGDLPEASERFNKALCICVEMGLHGAIAGLLELCGELNRKMGKTKFAVQLYAAASRIRVETGVPCELTPPGDVDGVTELLRKDLGEATFLAEWQAGEQLTTAEVVSLVVRPGTAV